MLVVKMKKFYVESQSSKFSLPVLDLESLISNEMKQFASIEISYEIRNCKSFME